MTAAEHTMMKRLIAALADSPAHRELLREAQGLLKRPRETVFAAALSEIGRRGGAKMSERKLASCRANAVKGGRPPKQQPTA